MALHPARDVALPLVLMVVAQLFELAPVRQVSVGLASVVVVEDEGTRVGRDVLI